MHCSVGLVNRGLLNKEKLHQSLDFGAQGLFKLLRRYQSDNLYQSMLRLESDMNRKTGANFKKNLMKLHLFYCLQNRWNMVFCFQNYSDLLWEKLF